MKISILKQDIKEGVAGHPKRCAIARRIAKIFPKEYIVVYQDAIEIGGDTFYVPKSVSAFLKAFDYQGGKPRVKPFSFNLPIKVK